MRNYLYDSPTEHIINLVVECVIHLSSPLHYF
jgi:hypothetical protein